MNTPEAEHRWYVAVLVVRAVVDARQFDDEPLFDHQVRLLLAPDHESAYARALEIGSAGATSYLNEDGERVSWEFVGLHDLNLLQSGVVQDGTEVYSWLERGDSAKTVVPKEQLGVFYWEANEHRTARELLGDSTDD